MNSDTSGVVLASHVGPSPTYLYPEVKLLLPTYVPEISAGSARGLRGSFMIVLRGLHGGAGTFYRAVLAPLRHVHDFNMADLEGPRSDSRHPIFLLYRSLSSFSLYEKNNSFVIPSGILFFTMRAARTTSREPARHAHLCL